MSLRESHKIREKNMRTNKLGQKAVDRETYRALENNGVDMRAYYMEGQSGGLVNEALTLGQHIELEEFVRNNDTSFKYTREDGSQFMIRINGAEIKD